MLKTNSSYSTSTSTNTAKVNSSTFDKLTSFEQASYIADMPVSKSIDEVDEGRVYQSGYVIAKFRNPAFDGDVLIAQALDAISNLVSIVQGNEFQPAKINEYTALFKVRENVSVSKAVFELNENENFENAQPNYIYTLADVPNDPDLSKQVQIEENLKQAWDLQKTDGSVTVAVLDSGIDVEHEDLSSNIKEATTRIWELDLDNLPNYYWDTTSPEDQSPKSHGTHCAGVISAISNNKIGISGVSYNAQILSIRVFKERSTIGSSTTKFTTTSTDVCGAIDYAISKKDEYNLRVISMSFGTESSDGTTEIEDQIYSDKIDEAYQAGITCVAASGNDNKSSVQFPAASEHAIAVGAVDNSGVRCYFSNYGPELDVVAQGWEIYSTIKGSYGTLSGTSMATPYVAGVAALCYAANPSLTPENLYKILTATANRTQGKFTNEYGYGKVDPLNAVKAAKALPNGAQDSFAVYFNADGADATPVGQVVASGDKVIINSEVTKKGYHLEGWYTDESLLNKWDFSTPVSADMTLWAKWGTAQCDHSDIYDNGVQATCIEGGHVENVCKSCGWIVESQVLDALGHNQDDERIVTKATCIKEGLKDIYCSRCGELQMAGVETAINEHNHESLVTLERIEPTCTKSGLTDGAFCNDCNTIVVPQTKIPALTHQLTSIEGLEPTCTSPGNIAYYECERDACKKKCTLDESGNYVEIDDVTLVALGHEMSHFEEVPALCESDGNVEYWHCEREDKNFVKDESGEYVEVTDVVIKATGHTDLTNDIRVEPTCSQEGQNFITCNVCKKMWVQALPKDASVHKRKEVRNYVQATCQENSGYSGDTYCYDCGVEIEKGHSTTDPDNHTSIISIMPRVEPTCSSVGWTGIQVCTAHKDPVCVQNNVEIPIDPNNHVNLTKVEALPATCKEDGHSEYEVCECGIEIGKTIISSSTIPHTFVKGVCTVCGAEDPTYVEETFTPAIVVEGSGFATLDKETYREGDSGILTVRGTSSDNSVIIPKLLKVDGQTFKTQDDLIDRSAWVSENVEYKRRMGEEAIHVEFENVVSSLDVGVDIEVGNLNNDTTIEVEFEEIVPVYRLYNMITSEHLFTTNRSEYEQWVSESKSDSDYWIGEGINWFAPKASTSTVKRLYNPALGALGHTSHYYTSDDAEIETLTKYFGWQDESVSNMTFASGGEIPIWTCYNEALGSAHHYTSSRTEWSALSNHGWNLEEEKNGSQGVFKAILSAVS